MSERDTFRPAGAGEEAVYTPNAKLRQLYADGKAMRAPDPTSYAAGIEAAARVAEQIADDATLSDTAGAALRCAAAIRSLAIARTDEVGPRMDLPGGYYLCQLDQTTCSVHAPDGLHMGTLLTRAASDFADASRALAPERGGGSGESLTGYAEYTPITLGSSTTHREPAPPAASGWKLVPVEPTEEMIAAGWIDKEDVDPDDIYRAMLAAAPPPPVPAATGWRANQQLAVVCTHCGWRGMRHKRLDRPCPNCNLSTVQLWGPPAPVPAQADLQKLGDFLEDQGSVSNALEKAATPVLAQAESGEVEPWQRSAAAAWGHFREAEARIRELEGENARLKALGGKE